LHICKPPRLSLSGAGNVVAPLLLFRLHLIVFPLSPFLLDKFEPMCCPSSRRSSSFWFPTFRALVRTLVPTSYRFRPCAQPSTLSKFDLDPLARSSPSPPPRLRLSRQATPIHLLRPRVPLLYSRPASAPFTRTHSLTLTGRSFHGR
jgi:hypothetical protein